MAIELTCINYIKAYVIIVLNLTQYAMISEQDVKCNLPDLH